MLGCAGHCQATLGHARQLTSTVENYRICKELLGNACEFAVVASVVVVEVAAVVVVVIVVVVRPWPWWRCVGLGSGGGGGGHGRGRGGVAVPWHWTGMDASEGRRAPV